MKPSPFPLPLGVSPASIVACVKCGQAGTRPVHMGAKGWECVDRLACAVQRLANAWRSS